MAGLTDVGRVLGHHGESPGAKEVLPACCLGFGTIPGAGQVFRAENDWKPGWKGLEVSSCVANGGERAADTSLTYFMILLQVSEEESGVPCFQATGKSTVPRLRSSVLAQLGFLAQRESCHLCPASEQASGFCLLQ